MFIPQIPRPVQAALEASSVHANTTIYTEPAGWWLQGSLWLCKQTTGPCHTESVQVLALIIGLSAVVVISIWLFAFFREDKEEFITPLCPQLIVKDANVLFRIPFEKEFEDSTIPVLDSAGNTMFNMGIEYPEPSQLATSSVSATARFQSAKDGATLASVVVRNGPMAFQALAICRAAPSSDIFGYLEPEATNRYIVRHRTGVHLLTIIGDFEKMNIRVLNPVKAEVCTFMGSAKVGGYHGSISQHVDAGLVLCALFATQMHLRMSDSSASFRPPCGRWPPGPPTCVPSSVPVTPSMSHRSPDDSDSDMTKSAVQISESQSADVNDVASEALGTPDTTAEVPQSPGSQRRASSTPPSLGSPEQTSRHDRETEHSISERESSEPCPRAPPELPLGTASPQSSNSLGVPTSESLGPTVEAPLLQQRESREAGPVVQPLDPTDPPEVRPCDDDEKDEPLAIDEARSACCGLGSPAAEHSLAPGDSK